MRSVIRFLVVCFTLCVSPSVMAVMSFSDFSKPLPNGYFADYHQLLEYQSYIAQNSPRAALLEIGYTTEFRKMQLLAFSSAETIKNLQKSGTTDASKLVIWLSFSAHGNEISGTQAALNIIEQLSNKQDPQTLEWLDSAIILFELVANPDGYQRFVQRIGQYRSAFPVSDPQHQQHLSPWPAARGNHYWFDLNRDWLTATQKETQNRIKFYHQWNPHLLADFHEMPSGNRYFFQPGVKSRINPLTPAKNNQLTQSFADSLARQFDQEQARYFSQEDFDDFFIGKASTYPDLQGSVGLLLEQSSSKGQLLTTEDGLLSYQQTVAKHQSGISSVLTTALASRNKLLEYRKEFINSSQRQQNQDDLSGYLVTSAGNRTLLADFQTVLSYHQIESQVVIADVRQQQTLYKAEESLFIPLKQAQYLLIKSLFSKQTNFKDTLFYDVSNWNPALAYNLQPAAVNKNQNQPKTRDGQVKLQSEKRYPGITAPPFACLIDWREDSAAPLLNQLLAQGLKVRVAKKSFRGIGMQGPQNYPAGSLLVLLSENSNEKLKNAMQTMQQYHAPCRRLLSGHSAQGPDLGSRQQVLLTPVNAAIFSGNGTHASEVGELWQHFEKHLKMPLSLLNLPDSRKLDLKNYTHLIMADGNYQNIPNRFVSQLELWLRQGGTLITFKRASVFASQHNLIRNEFLSERDLNSAFTSGNLSFSDIETLQSKKMISGAVFNVKLDLGHPLAFGYTTPSLPIFRNDRIVLLNAAKPFYDVAKYTASPLVAGYTSDANIRMIKNSTALTTHKQGKGQVIAFSDNPVYRGYWRGTARLLNNAIFFAPLIEH